MREGKRGRAAGMKRETEERGKGGGQIEDKTRSRGGQVEEVSRPPASSVMGS